MSRTPEPSISAVIAAYQAEEWIAQTLESILGQTRPPEEIVVVDDGSTDGTARELERFAGRIRIITQANGGTAAAFNVAFGAASGDFVAMCGADDLWEPDKLERQAAALRAHPEIDVAITGARFFGLTNQAWMEYPQAGVLEPRAFTRELYRRNFICASSTLIRRAICEQVGLFDERTPLCEDYDLWLRALAAGGVFFYDPTCLVRYRAHARQVTKNLLPMRQCEYAIHQRHTGLISDQRLAREVQANDLSNIARTLVDLDRPRDARGVFVASLRRRPTPRVAAWIALLSAPDRYRLPLADRIVSIKRAMYPLAL